MKLRFEIIDSTRPRARGMRFSSLERAMRELGHAVPRDRFYVVDKVTWERFQ